MKKQNKEKEPVALTVGQLKNLLKNVPDDYPLGTYYDSIGISNIKIDNNKKKPFCWLMNDTTNYENPGKK